MQVLPCLTYSRAHRTHFHSLTWRHRQPGHSPMSFPTPHRLQAHPRRPYLLGLSLRLVLRALKLSFSGVSSKDKRTLDRRPWQSEHTQTVRGGNGGVEALTRPAGCPLARDKLQARGKVAAPSSHPSMPAAHQTPAGCPAEPPAPQAQPQTPSHCPLPACHSALPWTAKGKASPGLPRDTAFTGPEPTLVMKGTKSFRKGRRHLMNHMAMT